MLKQPKRFKQLFDCYLSDDELVRLRTSNAMKCVARENTALLVPYLDAMLDDISKIPQPLVRWTPAQLFVLLTEHMSKPQLVRAKKILKRNLASGSDWTWEVPPDSSRSCQDSWPGWPRPGRVTPSGTSQPLCRDFGRAARIS